MFVANVSETGFENNPFLDRLREYMGRRVPDHAASLVGVGGDRGHVGVDVRCPTQITQGAVRVADHDDRRGFAPTR